MSNIFTAIGNFFDKVYAWFGKSNRWSRKNKSLMRETHKNEHRGCIHAVNYQPKGRKYAKGAGGSVGIGIDPRFSKSVWCRLA